MTTPDARDVLHTARVEIERNEGLGKFDVHDILLALRRAAGGDDFAVVDNQLYFVDRKTYEIK